MVGAYTSKTIGLTVCMYYVVCSDMSEGEAAVPLPDPVLSWMSEHRSQKVKKVLAKCPGEGPWASPSI